MEIKEAKTLLSQTENDKLEFKLCQNKLGNSFWETYSAFSNTNGGVIILGAEEENSRVKSIVGVNNSQKIKIDIINAANSKDKVSFNAIKEITIVNLEQDKEIIVVVIESVNARYKPVYLKNNIKKAYVRLGDSDQLINDNLLKSMIINSRENLDSELLPATFTIDDINLETVKRYRDFIKEDFADYDENIDEFLVQIGVFKKDRQDVNKLKLTKGGLLFFGKFNAITDIIPHFQLDYFEMASNSEIRWEDRVSTGDMEYPELNIFDFYLIVNKKIGDSLKDKFMLDQDNNQRLPYKNNLKEAFREALTNCLMHAHYDNNFPIKIKSYERYIEFFNPGMMRISIEEFFNGGTSRVVNDVIATLFRRIGISEKAGTGGKRIFDISEKLNLKNPEVIITADGCTKLRIWKRDLLSTLDGSKNEIKIMEYMLEHLTATKKELCDNLNISDYYARMALDKLSLAEHIKKVGKGRATKYVVSIQNPRGKTAILRNVIKMMDEE